MELEIYSPNKDGFIKTIEWNHEAIKKEVAEKVERYKNLVYSEEQIQDAKTDRANLRKFVEALETKRKEIKKQCLEPYEAFEKQMKEIVGIVNEPILLIDTQVKNYEEQERKKKLDEITEIFNNGNFPDWVTFDMIRDDKWLNASVKMSTIRTEIEGKLKKITNDLDILANLPEFAFEATEVYKDTLDLNKAINEGKRLSELMKRKAEAEAKAEAEKVAISKTETITETAPTISPETETRRWVGFEAYITTDEARALRDFFVTRNISFRSPQKN
jgi:hypothetical protein